MLEILFSSVSDRNPVLHIVLGKILSDQVTIVVKLHIGLLDLFLALNIVDREFRRFETLRRLAAFLHQTLLSICGL